MPRSAATCRSRRGSTACAARTGQIRVAGRLMELLAGSAIRASHLVDCARVQDPYSLRCQPQVMGACLDLLEAAGRTLEREANGVSDNPLVFAPSAEGEVGEILSGGNFHGQPVAFAADQIALALSEIGSLAERRIALLTDPALSGLPAFLSPEPGLNSGFMLPQIAAAALASENQHLAHPVAIDSRPTSANQEDHVSMATYAAQTPSGDDRERRPHRRDRAVRGGPGDRAPPPAADQSAPCGRAWRGACAMARSWPRTARSPARFPDLRPRSWRAELARRTSPVGVVGKREKKWIWGSRAGGRSSARRAGAWARPARGRWRRRASRSSSTGSMRPGSRQLRRSSAGDRQRDQGRRGRRHDPRRAGEAAGRAARSGHPRDQRGRAAVQGFPRARPGARS